MFSFKKPSELRQSVSVPLPKRVGTYNLHARLCAISLSDMTSLLSQSHYQFIGELSIRFALLVSSCVEMIELSQNCSGSGNGEEDAFEGLCVVFASSSIPWCDIHTRSGKFVIRHSVFIAVDSDCSRRQCKSDVASLAIDSERYLRQCEKWRSWRSPLRLQRFRLSTCSLLRGMPEMSASASSCASCATELPDTEFAAQCAAADLFIETLLSIFFSQSSERICNVNNMKTLPVLAGGCPLSGCTVSHVRFATESCSDKRIERKFRNRVRGRGFRARSNAEMNGTRRVSSDFEYLPSSDTDLEGAGAFPVYSWKADGTRRRFVNVFSVSPGRVFLFSWSFHNRTDVSSASICWRARLKVHDLGSDLSLRSSNCDA